MFPFLRRKHNPLLTFSALHTDMHSHVLPGIDDGAPDVETSIQLIRGLMDLGYTAFIATPHIYQDIYPNTAETILSALETTRTALHKEGLSVRLDAAAEYMLDDHFEHLLDQGPLMTLPGNRVLVEMSMLSPPPLLDHYLFRMQVKGYVPLIAHPERYIFLKTNKNRYHDWVERGCELQLNLLSLTAYYGPTVRDLALYLLKNKLVHFAGTDTHHTKHVELLQQSLKDKNVAKLLDYEDLLNATL